MITLLQAALLLVFPVLVIVGALRDLTSFTIPNWISGLLILAFFPAALLVGIAPMAIGAHLLIGLGALAVGIGMFALRWIGGGDAKLFAAAALWLGAPAALAYVVMTGLAGGAGVGADQPALAAAAPLRAQRPGLVRTAGRSQGGGALRRGDRGRGAGDLRDLAADAGLARFLNVALGRVNHGPRKQTMPAKRR